MATEHSRPSSKSMHALLPPMKYPTLTALQSSIPINPQQSNFINSQKAIIKDLREVNLLHEIYPFQTNKTRIQETVEIVPQPVSCERIFYSYTNDHTDLRSRECIKLYSKNSDRINTNNNLKNLYHGIEYNQRFQLDVYSTTLFIFPKQRIEKFITEIRYIPEHITIRYKTSLELLATTLASSQEHYYQNIHDFYHISKDIFYRI
ncbi:unnamed protein product [Rotaria magnacalcarata]|uniref:Uncharacterized protein n=1 Tax=Rotaria magnacalcarata TaxID=392030 RepID=A0A814Z8W4_9BILA|nr:unnamed protein product [Rotaria magnacalcarata]CAF1482547.1 unnamed protein product [Rotaria magnacalcarata]CAF2038360.1 unnamed protein product [Rotaria magnacalcarata]CAF2072204.1 unnamed protein product [Rotaria magnacalcarata]CAF2093775.1 unnamed protein product [Rotaria magnacalcarata]